MPRTSHFTASHPPALGWCGAMLIVAIVDAHNTSNEREPGDRRSAN